MRSYRVRTWMRNGVRHRTVHVLHAEFDGTPSVVPYPL